MVVASDIVPEALVETKNNADHFSDFELVERVQFGCRQCRRELHDAIFPDCRSQYCQGQGDQDCWSGEMHRTRRIMSSNLRLTGFPFHPLSDGSGVNGHTVFRYLLAKD